MTLDVHIEDLTVAIDERTNGAGFAPEAIPDAAEFFLAWATERGLIGDQPQVVHILTDRWHGSTAVRAVRAGLLDAQMEARRLVCSRVRSARLGGGDWTAGRNDKGEATYFWRAVVGGQPAGEYTITVTRIA